MIFPYRAYWRHVEKEGISAAFYSSLLGTFKFFLYEALRESEVNDFSGEMMFLGWI